MVDLTQIATMVLGLIKGIYHSIYGIAATVYPNNPTLVMLIGAIATIYFLKDKIANIAMYVVAGLILFLLLGGGMA